jgi:hypothetical protein
MIAAAQQVMTIANENTKIIPGHLGPVVGFKEIRQQLVMFTAVRVQGNIDKRMRAAPPSRGSPHRVQNNLGSNPQK